MEVKHRVSGRVLYVSEKTTLKEVVVEAVSKGAYLRGADLRGANLSGTDLFEADLLFCKMDKTVFKQITEEWFEWEVI